MYEGKKEWFDNLWYKTFGTVQYLVIHLSFSSIGYKELELENAIEKRLKDIGKEQQLILEKEGVSQLFHELLKTVSQKTKSSPRLSIIASWSFTPYKVTKQSFRGSGFEYWLGYYH